MRFSIRFLIVFIIFVFTTINLSAQTNILFTTYLIRDDNAFKNRNEYREWINNSTLHLGKAFTGENYQLQGYYSIDLLRFTNNNDLNNYSHKFGLSGSRNYGDYSVNVNAYARLHKYQEQYIYYQLNRYNLNANVQFTPNLQNIYRLSLTINKDQYKEFTDLDNFTYRIFGRYQHFFRSKLSVSVNAGLGNKNYVNQSVIQYFGTGTGRFVSSRYREDPVRATMLSLSVNVGKSITTNTGISFGVGGQSFLGEPIMAYSEGIYYYTENDLYDDPYSYSDRYISFQLTRQFAVNFQGRIGIKYQDKNYKGTPALDEIGDLTGETREDTRSEYFFMLLKKFNTNWQFPGALSLFFSFIYRNNPSNDPYYDFEDHIGLLGFSIGL